METAFVARLVIGCLMAAAVFEARAQSVDKPMLLVASPDTTGFYSRAVMVVVPKGDGHVGFMINRGTHTTIASAFPHEPEMAKVLEPIYLGGPRDAQSMYAVVRRDPGEGSRRLFGDVFVTISGKTVDRIIQESPGAARYFAGFSAWDAGELANEIQKGDWLLTPADEATLFHQHPQAMWAELVQRIGNTF